ncbi:MAG: hypothetical protein M1377_06320 [Deltaproteobacteria bacterium]|nr:hypothetical protein [Deltaproteobacteria bacterium]
MSIEDKELIETRFGPLWSGKTEIAFRGSVLTLRDVKRSLDLEGSDVVEIDLHELPEARFAFRFYDGDDRRVVVFVLDAECGIVEEHRAHVAEWLGDLYHDTGLMAFDPEAIANLLRRKIAGEL